jgi:ATP-binding cassette subfamily B protein
MRPYWPHLLGIIALSFLSIPAALMTPLPLKIAVDSVVGSKDLPAPLEAFRPIIASFGEAGTLLLAAGLVVGIALVMQLIELSRSLLQAYTGEHLVFDFRAQLFRHVQRLSLAYHDSRGTADSTYRIQYDSPAIQWIAVDGAIGLITAIATVVGMLVVTARIDWQLALVALAVSPILLLVSTFYGHRMREEWSQFKRLESTTLSVVQEVLTALRVVKAFGQEDREQARYAHHSGAGMRARVRIETLEAGFALLVAMITSLGIASVLFIGIRHVQAGVVTLGELLIVMTYLFQLYVPLQTISKKSGDVQASLVGAERAFGLLEESPDVSEREDARPLGRASGAVSFTDVSFGYTDDRPVLERVSFAISPGTRVGIAGTTGAGKTTLVSLLTRFYDPSSGYILLDGVDLRDYKLADLRNQFAIVLQEPVLFSTTIAENIAYARPGAGHEEIVQAAKDANAHEFINRLPDGYDTQVGERGMRLSGGERQRISLARAFLKDAPILILDEPTSSVDVKTEAVIVEAMERLMEGRTTFVIAHRLTMLEGCDRLVLIEQGRVADFTSDVAAVIRNRFTPEARGAAVSGSVS